jgi:Terminase large subunit, T4likevirus-type, N-terminal
MKALNKAEQIQEILRCGKDPIYFMKKYVKIQHAKRGLIPFETYDFQDDCVKSFEDNRFNIVLKSRQLGLSTITAAYATWFAIFKKDKNVLVIATKLPTAMNFIKKVRIMLEGLPKWLLLTKFEPTKQAIRFDNGSTITAIPTSPDAGRSEALSLLIVDEAAFIRDFEDIWTGLYPTLSTGGSAIIISTPNGVGGQYYHLWMDGETKQNEFNTIKLPWWVHPEHDQEWFDRETRNLPKRKIAQEFLCDFITSGDTFLHASDLESIRDAIKPPLEKSGPQNAVWTWRRPETDKRYVIAADVARGDAGDFSTFHVVDDSTCEVVAEYMGKIPPDKLADLLFEYGKKYNDALICPEQNTFGYFTCVKLRDDGYPRLYYQGSGGDPFEFRPTDPSAIPGFSTQAKTRVQVLAKLEELVRNNTVKVYSQRLYDQLQAFMWNGSRAQASKSSHDDLIMSLAIACWLVEGDSGVNEQASAMAYAMLKATKVDRKNDMPGDIGAAKPLVNPSIRGLNPTSRDVYKPRDPSSVKHVDVSDFSWLYR